MPGVGGVALAALEVQVLIILLLDLRDRVVRYANASVLLSSRGPLTETVRVRRLWKTGALDFVISKQRIYISSWPATIEYRLASSILLTASRQRQSRAKHVISCHGEQ